MIDYDSIWEQKLGALRQEGNYRYFLQANKNAQHFPHFYYEDTTGNLHKAVNWCSNDYLGMSVHQEVIRTMQEVTNYCGAGSGGTRNISGTTSYHKALEQELALLHTKPAALVFGSAYLANITSLSTIGKLFPEIVFISDEENHASIIEGIRNSGRQKIIFRHNDIIHLEEILQQLPCHTPKIIVFESVYSMSGSIAPIRAITQLAKKYNCLTYIDEVHAVGLYADNASGYTGLTQTHRDVDIINGTLAKSFGVLGGYIAASEHIIDCIRSYGSGFIFTTSLPPAVCAAALKSIQIVQQSPYIRASFHKNVATLKTVFRQYEIPFRQNNTHILPITIGNAFSCKKIADQLLKNDGIYIQPVNYPTVKKNEECLRIIISAKHTEEDIIYLADRLKNRLIENKQAREAEWHTVLHEVCCA